MLLPVMPIGVLSTFAMVTAAPSYWFHPRSLPIVRQNRAVAISAYLCAPLTWWPLLALIAAAGVSLSFTVKSQQSDAYWSLVLAAYACALAAVLLLLLMWWNTLR